MTDEYSLLEDRYFGMTPEQLRKEITRISDRHTLHDSMSPQSRYWEFKQKQLSQLLKEKSEAQYRRYQFDRHF